MGPALAFALLLGADAPAPADVVTAPDWAKKPTSSDVSRFYPSAASWMGLEGSATLECTVFADGTLHDCQVLAETPEGYGFGDATVRAAYEEFRFKPQKINGRPTSDGRVRFTLKFAVPPFKGSDKLSARCAGWAQAAAERAKPAPARLVWAATYWRFAYVAAATRLGVKPSAIEKRLEESRQAAAPRIARASSEYQECWRIAYSFVPSGFMPGGPR